MSSLLCLPVDAAEPAARRPSWTGSRVLGSPEPPLPYVAERMFPRLSFREPTEVAFIPHSGIGAGTALVMERAGQLLAFPGEGDPPTPWLVADFTRVAGKDCEAYSIAFHPGHATNHFVFVALFSRTNSPRGVRLSRFVLRPGNPPVLDLASERPVIEWATDGHNGCSLQFGRDGFLYASSGDAAGPAPPDPLRTGQNLDDLLSVILRIDVDGAEAGRAYRVPADNPFVNTPGARPEIWAYGFRNPWKICVDPRDGALWVADVGWEAWELVYRIERGGFNGGWSLMEGPQAVNSGWPRGPTPIVAPTVVHPHTEAASVTGGYVYRGRRLPGLKDSYIYGDWESGKIWELLWRDGAVVRRSEIADTPFRIIGFGLDNEGEIYFADYTGGGIYRLSPSPAQPANAAFPRRLSDTGLFAATREHALAPGVVRYTIAAPSWADHATAEFAVALPGDARLGRRNGDFTIPTNAVFARTLSMELQRGRPASRRRLETQLLHFDGADWNGYTYRWNDPQTDAELVGRDGAEMPLVIEDAAAPGGRREQTWRFHSRAECNRCHMPRFGYLNAFIPEQLRGAGELERLLDLGLFDAPPRQRSQPFALANPYAVDAPLETRARSWLHANCAHCHRENASGAVVMFLHAEMAPGKTLVLDRRPQRGDFGIADACLVAPGEPFRSALLYRALTPGAGRMPILGSTEVDDVGARVLRDWIFSLAPASSNAVSADLPVKDPVLDELLRTTGGAMRLAMIAAEPATLAAARERMVARAAGHSHPATRDLFERFLPAAQRRKLLGPAPEPALILTRTGENDRGRRLFFGDGGGQCHTCHRVAGEGRDFGPDLSRIGAKFDRAALLEQLLHPNKLIEPAWVARAIETTDGESQTGFVVSRTETEWRLKVADGSVKRLDAAAIRSDARLSLSLMPEGLLQAFTAQEAADLLEFLSLLR